MAADGPSLSRKNLQEPCKDEETALLSNSNRANKRKRKTWCTFRWIIKCKGAIVVLSWVALVQSFDPMVAISIAGLGSEHQDVIFTIYAGFSLLLYVFYPVIGLYADMKFGRHRIATVVLIISLLSTVILSIGTILTEKNLNTIAALVIFSFGFILGSLSRTIFIIIMAMYGFEQLVEASGEELSAYAHWYYWCRIFGWVITVPAVCSVNIPYGVLIIYGLHIIFVMGILLSSYKTRELMISDTCTHVNPVTQIIKIISYARRNKYPRNRSALTYWEESSPSRLDLGKEKYGGPYTEESVENVKTFFRILPLLVCMVAFIIMTDQFNPYFFMLGDGDQYRIEDCLFSSVYFVTGGVLLITMVIYQIFKPLFDKCLRTMLRRIGVGIFLVMFAQFSWLGFDVAGNYHSDELNSTCIFNIPYNNTANISWSISHFWILLPRVLMGVAFGIALPTSLEFVFAQAPYSMKGLVVGVWFMAVGSFKMMGFFFHFPFKYIEGLQLNCSFYYYLTKSVFIGLSLLCYICLALWYKPRQRELYFNPHATVEAFYERDFVRRDMHEEERKRRKRSGESDEYQDLSSIDIHEYLSSLYKPSLEK